MATPADLAQALWAAIQHVRHYRPGHPSAELSVLRCAAALREAAPVRIDVEARRLVVQGQPLSPADPAAASLRDYLQARQVPALAIGTEATEASVAALVRVLAREPEEIVAAGGLRDALEEEGASGIAVPEQASAVLIRDVYDEAVAAAAAVIAAVGRGEPVDVPRIREVAVELVQKVRRDPLALWARVADRNHDETDPSHLVNTAVLAVSTAASVDVAEPTLVELAVAGLLHDVGLAVLPYRDRLAERTAAGPRPTWTHPARGAHLLRALAGRSPVVPAVAAEHHLPSLGGGASAPATLVSLADYVDALTCGRVPAHRATAVGPLLSRLLSGSGPAFDPAHVRALARLVQAASGTVPGRKD